MVGKTLSSPDKAHYWPITPMILTLRGSIFLHQGYWKILIFPIQYIFWFVFQLNWRDRPHSWLRKFGPDLLWSHSFRKPAVLTLSHLILNYKRYIQFLPVCFNIWSLTSSWFGKIYNYSLALCAKNSNTPALVKPTQSIEHRVRGGSWLSGCQVNSNFDHYLSASSLFCVRQFLSSQQFPVFILDEIQRSVISSVCLWHWNGHTRTVRKTPGKISVCSDFTDIFPQKTGLNIYYTAQKIRGTHFNQRKATSQTSRILICSVK